MAHKNKNYLLIDIDNEFSRSFAEYTLNDEHVAIIIAGINSRKLIKMVFDRLVKDYCYCDIENEISVSELASYLHQHHDIDGVLLNQTDYLLADDKQRFIYNSLHPQRFSVKQTEQGYTLIPITDEAYSNHLSCYTDIAQTTMDQIEPVPTKEQK